MGGLLVAVGLLAAACSGTGNDDAAAPPTEAPTESPTEAQSVDIGGVQLISALQPFDSCDAFLGHMRTEAQARVGPYGLDGGGGFFPMPVDAVAEEADDAAVEEATEASGEFATADSGTATTAQSGGAIFSDTNVQVIGVDEPDIVKTDGNRILAVASETLYYVDVSGPEAVLRGSVELGGYANEMFMTDDRAFVLSGGDLPVIAFAEDAEASFSESSEIAPFVPTTRVVEVDLSNPDALSIVNTMEVEGNYVSARAVDGIARVVVSSFPNDLGFVFPSNPAGEERAEQANRDIIASSTLEDWLPSYTLVDAAGASESGLLVDCANVSQPTEFSGFNTLSVLTVDMGAPLGAPQAVSVVADGTTVYASDQNLYIATNQWFPFDVAAADQGFEEELSTAIHKFAITDPGLADYVASGSVRGNLINQFAMNEHQGYLQVATTDGFLWEEGPEQSESFVTVLETVGEELVQVGQVGDLGKGEQITAVRFLGDFASVVTFRQIDPLFTIDMRDPTNPVVTGELKIPGFSSYLHPLPDGLVLGVGQDATEEGFTTGAKVSLFDVSDPAAPAEVDTFVLPGGYSDVEWDHRAFLYWAPENLAVIPMQSWEEGFFGAIVLRIEDGTLVDAGRISHPQTQPPPTTGCRPIDPVPGFSSQEIVQICPADVTSAIPGYFCEVAPVEQAEDWFGISADSLGTVEPGDQLEICWPEFGPPTIQRTLVIGENLWSLSFNSLQANSLATLEPGQFVALG